MCYKQEEDKQVWRFALIGIEWACSKCNITGNVVLGNTRPMGCNAGLHKTIDTRRRYTVRRGRIVLQRVQTTMCARATKNSIESSSEQ